MRRLRALVQQYPTQAAAARAMRVSPPFLNMVLSGRKQITDDMLKRVGLKRVVMIVEAK